MQTEFNIGEKVYFDIPYAGWGWVEKITIRSEDHIVYQVRTPYHEIHYKLEKSLRKTYGGEEKER